MKHEDGYEAFWLRVNPAQDMTGTDAPVRPYPRFASLPEFTPGESFTATIPTALRTWWVFGVLVIGALWFFVLPLGIALGIDAGGFDNRGRLIQPSFSWTPGIFTAIVLAAVSYGIWRAVFPRIKIQVDREVIQVGKYRYTWDTASGMRVGYSIGGVERSSEEGVLWVKFTGMRMAYGQWGHDLPYMTNTYYSVAYAAWINQLLETIKHNTETVNDPAAGIKQELY